LTRYPEDLLKAWKRSSKLCLLVLEITTTEREETRGGARQKFLEHHRLNRKGQFGGKNDRHKASQERKTGGRFHRFFKTGFSKTFNGARAIVRSHGVRPRASKKLGGRSQGHLTRETTKSGVMNCAQWGPAGRSHGQRRLTSLNKKGLSREKKK